MAHTARTAAPTNRSNRPVISGYPKKLFSARRPGRFPRRTGGRLSPDAKEPPPHPKNQKQNQYKDRDHRYRNSTVQPISVLEACQGLVSVRRVLESYESSVIQERWPY